MKPSILTTTIATLAHFETVLSHEIKVFRSAHNLKLYTSPVPGSSVPRPHLGKFYQPPSTFFALQFHNHLQNGSHRLELWVICWEFIRAKNLDAAG